MSEVYSLLMQAVVGRSTDQALEQSAGRMAAAKVGSPAAACRIFPRARVTVYECV